MSMPSNSTVDAPGQELTTGGELLLEALISEGVSEIFGLPGIQLDPAVDAVYRAGERMRFTAVRHEQSATYMADGYARVSGNPGVAMVVPGPGMLNAAAGLATALACSSPVLLICGQIPHALIGKGYGALHEVPDQTGILRTLTKWTGRAEAPEHIPELVHDAFFHMLSGRRGPVAIEIPVDILAAHTVADVGVPRELEIPTPSAESVRHAISLIEHAEFPVIYAGGGAVDAGKEIALLSEHLQAPIVVTRESRGCVDARHPLVLDPLAMRRLRDRVDLVIGVGSRLRRANTDPVDVGNARILAINSDADDGVSASADAHLISDAARGIEALIARLPSETVSKWGDSVGEIRKWAVQEASAMSPQMAYLDAIRSTLPDDGILVTEYTQVGYVASIAFPVHAPRSYIAPGYQGTLGYGFATSLGAQVAAPDRRVVSLNGDGGFSWTLSELSTMRKYSLNCVAIVFNDGHYGNVRRIQRDAYGGRYLGTDLTNPDYVALAEAFGIAAHRVSSADELRRVLSEEMLHPRPMLIEVVVGEFPSPWSFID